MITAILIVITILVLLFIFKTENFISSYEYFFKKSGDPIMVRYMGRERDRSGYDFYDHVLSNQLLYQQLNNPCECGQKHC
jgi:hypothetical protein